MDLQELQALVKESVRDADLRTSEIPSIDLYVDQITSLTTEKLMEGSERFRDRVLTKTMINNYSKDGLISPIKGKKYTKEQILQMLLVYSLKNTLSIGEIKRILQNVYAIPALDAAALERVYESFLDSKEGAREAVWELLESYVEKNALDVSNDADFFTLLLGLSALSSYLKNATQALLEARYPDLNAEKEREEQEKREEAKRQKEEKKEEKKAAKAKKEDAVEAEDKP